MKAAYRGLLRELELATPGRNASVKAPAAQFRHLMETSSPKHEPAVCAAMDDATLYLKSQREYLELLRRYNPLHDMSVEEHLNATVNRVGLQMPTEAPKDSSS